MVDDNQTDKSKAEPQKVSKPGYAEMSAADHTLLMTHLKQNNPRKILEIGISAGGTTKMLLDAKAQGSALHSVDVDLAYYRDKTRRVGYLAEEHYSEERHGEWQLYAGMDISECINKVGNEIDFVVLDTTHALPGEILSFLAVLPYLAEDSVLFLHDTALHLQYKHSGVAAKEPGKANYYCTSLLFNAISSARKFDADEFIPNSGIVYINRKQAMANIFQVINMLGMNWHYLPNPKHLVFTRKIMAAFYPANILELYDLAVNYNLGLMKLALKS